MVWHLPWEQEQSAFDSLYPDFMTKTEREKLADIIARVKETRSNVAVCHSKLDRIEESLTRAEKTAKK